MNSLIRNTVLNILGQFKKPSNSIHILNGHFVNRIVKGEDLNVFDDLLVELKKYFELITFQDACDYISRQQIAKKPLLSFSFDDAFIDCYEFIAPILEKHSTNACFFINPSIIEINNDEKRLNFISQNLNIELDKKFMTWDQIINLYRRGHCIGNHTFSHKALINLSYEDAYNEISKGKIILEKKLSYSNDYFAFPFGTPEFFDKTAIAAAISLHKYSFTSSFNYEEYFFQGNKQILSRRHFEGNWPVRHINYFTSVKRKY